MLKNILLELEYDGTNYFGWQIQNRSQKSEVRSQKLKTVQGELERALERLFKRKIRIIYAGRTDKGVHAKGQVVNFTIDTNIPLENIKNALNGFLAPDIRVKRVKRVPLDFHSRFNVKSKIYRYVIWNKKEPDVFSRNYAWLLPQKLIIEKMKKISRKLAGYKDFALFAKEAHKYKNCHRTIKNISIKKRGSFVYIDIEADGFLRNMARNIVSFLVKVGTAKLSLKEAKDILARKKPHINRPAPPHGLYLWKVNYV
jgi:tRNA pseudouridine38-40 synthase